MANEIARWKHFEVFTAARQVNLQLMGSNRLILLQLSLFRLLLLLIVGIVIGFVVYTFTLDKLKEIAMLKLLGAKATRVFGMITEQSLVMGMLGTLIGAITEFAVEPYFPRRVQTTYGDVVQMLLAAAVIAVVVSLFAVRRANRVDPRSVLSA